MYNHRPWLSVMDQRGVSLFRYHRGVPAEFPGIKGDYRSYASSPQRFRSGTILGNLAGAETLGAADCLIFTRKTALKWPREDYLLWQDGTYGILA